MATSNSSTTSATSDTAEVSDVAEPVVRLSGVSKLFPGVRALDEVDFEVYPGEVHVLFGENGAGKSTLANIIAGTYSQDEGEFMYQGHRITRLTPHQARLAGISPVFQEFSLVPHLTVEENLFLGREVTSQGVLRKGEMRRLARITLDNLGFTLPVNVKVRKLTRASQQMTEIAKALLQEVKLLILDEPTASLTEHETARLFELIDGLKSKGVGIIYVSHRMAEIRTVGDRVTVLRDGKKIGTVRASEVTDQDLVEMMTGRKIEVMFPHVEHRPKDVLLEVQDLGSQGRLDQVTVKLRHGEITGMAGLVGCGKSYLARSIFGLEKFDRGEVRVNGKPVQRPSPSRMLDLGVCYFPSDRVAEGLALARSIRENASMASLVLPSFSVWRVLRRRSELREVKRAIQMLSVRPEDPEVPLAKLSGGNRQKVMLMRALLRPTKIFLFDEPTVGIDVGAKTEVYELLKELAEDGAAVLLISSELPEVLNLSNRLYVMHRGRVVSELSGGDITEKNVLMSFFEGGEALPSFSKEGMRV